MIDPMGISLIVCNATALLIIAVAIIWVTQRDLKYHHIIPRCIMVAMAAAALSAAADNVLLLRVPLATTTSFHFFLAGWALLTLSPTYRSLVR